VPQRAIACAHRGVSACWREICPPDVPHVFLRTPRKPWWLGPQSCPQHGGIAACAQACADAVGILVDACGDCLSLSLICNGFSGYLHVGGVWGGCSELSPVWTTGAVQIPAWMPCTCQAVVHRAWWRAGRRRPLALAFPWRPGPARREPRKPALQRTGQRGCARHAGAAVGRAGLTKR
jgi:hypothetical protein